MLRKREQRMMQAMAESMTFPHFPPFPAYGAVYGGGGGGRGRGGHMGRGGRGDGYGGWGWGGWGGAEGAQWQHPPTIATDLTRMLSQTSHTTSKIITAVVRTDQS